MIATGYDIVRAALRKIGVASSGQQTQADQLADGLSALNDMIASWSRKRVLVFQIVRVPFALQPNKQVYTLGPGGDIDMPRPQRIDSAMALQSASYEVPVQVCTPAEWDRITIKNQSGAQPIAIYNDQANPLSSVSIWPVPTDSSYSIVLYLWQQFQQFALGSDGATFPPEYNEAIVYNLAVRLAPEYERAAAPEVISIADQSLYDLYALNAVALTMTSDRFGGRYNVFTDEVR